MTMRILILALLVACGAPGQVGGDDVGDDDVAPDAPNVPDGFAELIAGSWSLPAGDEGYHCVTLTLDADVWITAFHNTAPLGTHHTALSIGSPVGPDGSGTCEATDNQPTIIYGAGVGTPDFALPTGYAVRARAGQQLLMNLHIFNASDQPISGTSGVSIKTTTDTVAEAGVANTGKTSDLVVPPGASTQVGTCDVSEASTAFNVFPHMHKLGVHMRAMVDTTTLIDMPYSFDSQAYYPLAPARQLAPGDRIRVECSYQNDTGATVRFGQSSLEEMCGLGLYVSPPWSDDTCGF